MKYTSEYQRPAKGIMQTMELDNYKSYKIACECQSDDHVIDTCIEINSDKETNDIECTFFVNTWTPLFATRFERIRAAFNILCTGVHKQQHSLLLNKQAALNFSESLNRAINELEENKNGRKRIS